MKYGRKYQKLLIVGIRRIKNGSLQDIIVEFSVDFDHFTKVHRISTPLSWLQPSIDFIKKVN